METEVYKALHVTEGELALWKARAVELEASIARERQELLWITRKISAYEVLRTVSTVSAVPQSEERK